MSICSQIFHNYKSKNIFTIKLHVSLQEDADLVR